MGKSTPAHEGKCTNDFVNMGTAREDMTIFVKEQIICGLKNCPIKEIFKRLQESTSEILRGI